MVYTKSYDSVCFVGKRIDLTLHHSNYEKNNTNKCKKKKKFKGIVMSDTDAHESKKYAYIAVA